MEVRVLSRALDSNRPFWAGLSLEGVASAASLHVTLSISSLDGLTLVILLLACSKPDKHLDPTIDEIDLEWNDGPPLLSRPICPFLDFTLVSKKNTLTCWNMLGRRSCGRILRDVNTQKNHSRWLSNSLNIAFTKTDLSLSDGFNFSSGQLDATLSVSLMR